MATSHFYDSNNGLKNMLCIYTEIWIPSHISSAHTLKPHTLHISLHNFCGVLCSSRQDDWTSLLHLSHYNYADNVHVNNKTEKQLQTYHFDNQEICSTY